MRQTLGVEADLVERHDAAGTHPLGKLPEGGGRVRHVHEDEPADQGIEIVFQVQGARVARQELDIVLLSLGDTGPSGFQDLGIDVDAHHPALGTHQLGRGHGNVSRATADVQDLHAVGQARFGQHAPGQTRIHPRLADQAFGFGLSAAHGVRVFFSVAHFSPCGSFGIDWQRFRAVAG